MESVQFDSDFLKDLVSTPMPYGKYQGYMLADVPEHYLMWLSRQGFPKGRLGELLALAYEIRLNGLEHLLKPLKN